MPPLANKEARETQSKERAKQELPRFRPTRIARDLCILGVVIGAIIGVIQMRSYFIEPEEEDESAIWQRLYDESEEALKDGDLELAVSKARELVHLHAENGYIWLQYGRALLASERYDDAQHAFEMAESFDRLDGHANFYLAKVYCAKGESKKAMDCLTIANGSRFKPEQKVSNDPDFQLIQHEDRFRRVARELDEKVPEKDD